MTDKPRFDRNDRFGERAVAMGFVTDDQVREALAVQAALPKEGKKHKLLGLILHHAGALTNDQLIRVIKTYETEGEGAE